MEKIYEVVYMGVKLTVYDDCVSFQPKGLRGFLLMGMAGERKIFFKDITSIQYKPAGKFITGFIEFYFAGHNTQQQGGGIADGAQNENRFVFSHKLSSTMEKIKLFIENKIIKNQSIIRDPVQNNTTEEILKYKKLLDDGIITEEEFQKKKKQLLNI